jgi:hypothetical protein
MAEPFSNLKPVVPCACGCGLEGYAKKNGHVKRLCRCRACIGGQNRTRGMSSQRQFQKIAGIKQASWRGANGNEESWRDPFCWEHKDGAQVRPVVTAYRRIRNQIEANRAIGDHRPAAVGVSVDGLRLVIVAAEDWAVHVAPRFTEEAS